MVWRGWDGWDEIEDIEGGGWEVMGWDGMGLWWVIGVRVDGWCQEWMDGCVCGWAMVEKVCSI